MKAVIDHFEGSVAKLEVIGSKETLSVPKSSLPPVAGEGSVVENAGGKWVLDREETTRRRSLASDLVNSLLK